MIPALIMAVALLVVLPVAFIITGGVIAVILGQTLSKDVEYLNEGSELVELNV
ncbi:MAG: hypothetical protein ACOYOQ_10315 [Microthrixaceae bacterium]|jgi:hypothetical protein